MHNLRVKSQSNSYFNSFILTQPIPITEVQKTHNFKENCTLQMFVRQTLSKIIKERNEHKQTNTYTQTHILTHKNTLN